MPQTPSDWIGFWNASPTVYVSERHKAVHYRSIADGICQHISGSQETVLDFGCGEAIEARVVARRCRHLYLTDAAPAVRQGLTARSGDVSNITVLAPEDLASLPRGSVDLVVVNSVAQYLSRDQLGETIATLKPLLSPAGRILFADIIPPDVGPLTDARQLIAFGGRHGFAAHALVGLGRTFFSSYRKVRGALGLTQYSEPEFVAFLRRHGFDAQRTHPNLGHNQRRMAFIARPSGA